jgi:glutamate 5-kinase
MSEQLTVVKFGSELVTNQHGVDRQRIDDYTDGLVDYGIYEPNELLVVTSGAVEAGKARLRKQGYDYSDWDDITLAQLGAASVTRCWEECFEGVGVMAGGLLTTHHEIEDQEEGPSLLRAINLARERGVVSIVNENDALSIAELMELVTGGDNDGLAAHIARACGARTLKLFTKKGGVMNGRGELIEEVNSKNYHATLLMLKQRELLGKKGNGRGGMSKKLQAAWLAAQAGIQAEIAAVNRDMTGDLVTRFVVG